MTQEAKPKIQELSENNKWLFMHMITAFWHEFGISSGLTVYKEDLETITYSKGTPRQVYQVKPEAMRKHLEAYIQNLENYKVNWNTEAYDNEFGTKDFYKDTQAGRELVIKMIELLQI